MILSMYNQAYIFVATIGLGFLSGLIYDAFRIFRVAIKHNNILTQLEDIIYWVFVTFIMFRFVISNNDGEVRGFLIGGMVIGMAVY
ncbi:MAG: spore cortex biosynthesis protein YabQ, partial [Clostridiales bacterium]|nr:spore cortex biosynthesis protein YabQ [Clostridiales bacterium]